MLRSFVKLAAAAALVLSAPGSAIAQIQTIDPNQADSYQPDPFPYDEDQSQAPTGDVWTPIEEPSYETTPYQAETAPLTSPRQTVPREDIFTAAEDLFGRGTEGLAGMLESILRSQGEPIAYISGQEAAGAFVFGVRYGSGTMRHQIEGDRAVYWTGPSLGFDFGGDASKVFVLVYNLHDGQDLFRRYAGAEGNAYVVGGFTAQYLRRGDVVLIPIRLGVGLRLGVNAGYMRFSERNRWLPF
jgi:hypothetical protein